MDVMIADLLRDLVTANPITITIGISVIAAIGYGKLVRYFEGL